MSKHFPCRIKPAILILALFALLLPGIAAAQDGGDDEDNQEINLVTFEDPVLKIAGVVPQGWVQQQRGLFARGNGPQDVAALIVQVFPSQTSEAIMQSMATSLGIDALPEESKESRESEAFTWDIYTVEREVPDPQIFYMAGLALAETDQAVYFIVLQAESAEYETMKESILYPALDALTLLDWNNDSLDLYAQPDAEIARMQVEVIDDYAHDTDAFTQGLLYYDGALYESTGERGKSLLREVAIETGKTARSSKVPDEFFAEGLALVDGQFVQLTWESGQAFIYDFNSFERVGTFNYEGEGWGLCYDGEYLYMSDGSPIIDIRSPETFEIVAQGAVTMQGQPVNNVNELECVGDSIYANIWKAEVILRIDKATGAVTEYIDANGLLTEDELANMDLSREVLNGIAYNPETETFYITGKKWPRLFEVNFVEATAESAE